MTAIYPNGCHTKRILVGSLSRRIAVVVLECKPVPTIYIHYGYSYCMIAQCD